jgi:exonuclease SbcD
LRLVHTSDGHLGRRLGEADRLEDQAHTLGQILDLARDEKADAILVAGDVFDRAVPPVEAVDLFEDFLTRAARELRVPVIVGSGNHDSPERLGFGAGFFASAGIRLVTRMADRTAPILVGDVPIYVLPFVEPVAARAALAQPELRTHDQAVRAALADMNPERRPAVLVGHMFVAGGAESVESERPLAVGNAGQVAVDSLAGWSYVALGHLHVAQVAGGQEHIRYSGSPLKLSFGESCHRRGVSLVTVDGAVTVEHVELTPRRDVVRLEGSFAELLDDERFAFAEPAWVEATYTDAGYVLDAASRLRQRFPHLLAAKPAQLIRQVAGQGLAAALEPRGDSDLLRGFWKYVSGPGELGADAEAAFERALAAARAGDPEEKITSLEVVP